MTNMNEIARRILSLTDEPAVRVRLLRDVLNVGSDDVDLLAAIRDLDAIDHVRSLTREQRRDGGWGAFHSRDSKVRGKIPSTEVAVERALALGLDGRRPILARTRRHLLELLAGERRFPDYNEKNDRWATGMRLFVAATLASIDPDDPELDADRKLWREIAMRTFASGQYSADDEAQAHQELTGASVRGSYLVLSNRYALRILGSKPGLLPEETECSMVEWLWRRREGIGYLSVPLTSDPSALTASALDRWLTSLELLVNAFPGRRAVAGKAFDWLRRQADDDGLWDLGPRWSASAFFPLSGNWRVRLNRRIDWTTRVVLLQKGMQYQ